MWTGDLVRDQRLKEVRLTRYAPGTLPEEGGTVVGQAFDGRAIPLETLVECEAVQAHTSVRDRLRFAVDIGRHFLRVLEQQALGGNYEETVLSAFPLSPLTGDELRELDGDTVAFLDLLGTRVPDGRALYQALSASLRPNPPRPLSLPLTLAIGPSDVGEIQRAGLQWLEWVDTLFAAPTAGEPAWRPERMEYGVSLAARTGERETAVSAVEYFSGHLDWYDFDVTPGATLNAMGDAPQKGSCCTKKRYRAKASALRERSS